MTLSGMPFSTGAMRIKRWMFDSSRSAKRSMIFRRRYGSVSRHAGNARRAAATSASTSTAPASGTAPCFSPVDVLTWANVPAEPFEIHLSPIRSLTSGSDFAASACLAGCYESHVLDLILRGAEPIQRLPDSRSEVSQRPRCRRIATSMRHDHRSSVRHSHRVRCGRCSPSATSAR